MRSNDVPDQENELVVTELTEESAELVRSERGETGHRPSIMPRHLNLTLSKSRISTLAVVNDRGYVVPIFTATDLLLELKAIWRATQY